jgi:hypothetical protein
MDTYEPKQAVFVKFAHTANKALTITFCAQVVKDLGKKVKVRDRDGETAVVKKANVFRTMEALEASLKK